jgi:hypothetical protein
VGHVIYSYKKGEEGVVFLIGAMRESVFGVCFIYIVMGMFLL